MSRSAATESVSLHHVEICVADLQKVLSQFVNGFGFKPIARRRTQKVEQHVLSSEKTKFVITKRLSSPETNYLQNGCHELENQNLWSTFCCKHLSFHDRDSVFNIALCVKNVDEVTYRVKNRGGTVLKDPCTIYDDFGQVRYSVVQSCCGNIVHTIIDNTAYNGIYLPGYEIILSQDVPHFVTSYVDHVAVVCDAGMTPKVIVWYEEVFGMKRFRVNKNEDLDNGVVLGDNIGLKLKALEYWLCSGSSLVSVNQKDSFKLVVVEPLLEVKTSHVSKFLAEHGCPGVQHIGLHSPDIFESVKAWKKSGIIFRKPPPAYYLECGKLREITEVGLRERIEEFRELGVLIDSEADEEIISESTTADKRCLMQIFTRGLFAEDTFFMEVIQRCGATGFGEGNITALAQSIIKQQQLDNDLKTKSQLNEDA